MTYFITDGTGETYEFGNWFVAIKFAIHQARLHPHTPTKMSSDLNHYQVWANGEIDRLETRCACDTCGFCDSSNNSATCPHYWEQHIWEHYDTYEG
mgnify:CR=1 FL=1